MVPKPRKAQATVDQSCVSDRKRKNVVHHIRLHNMKSAAQLTLADTV